MLDDRDLHILTLLQSDARISNAEIGRAVGLAPSAVLERIRKLERRGVVRGYSARLDPAALGCGLLAFVFVQADERPGQTDLGEELAALPEALEVHHIAGEDCYLVKLRCPSTDALGRLLKERITMLPQVRRTRTTVVLGTVREGWDLAIPAAAEGGSHDPD
ncbi:MAG: AsnC family transcriptional regulator [Acidobacteriota bacterium]